MINNIDRKAARAKKKARIRGKISGTAERPRLAVFRSDKHIYAQVIDDVKGATLVACSTVEKDIAAQIGEMTKVESAKLVGKTIGEKAIAAGIKEVVFDRGGFLYTGRVQALADGAREAGLEF